jgi:hypothetical protein
MEVRIVRVFIFSRALNGERRWLQGAYVRQWWYFDPYRADGSFWVWDDWADETDYRRYKQRKAIPQGPPPSGGSSVQTECPSPDRQLRPIRGIQPVEPWPRPGESESERVKAARTALYQCLDIIYRQIRVSEDVIASHPLLHTVFNTRTLGSLRQARYEAICGLAATCEGERALLTYTNYKGVSGDRMVVIKRRWFGSTEWHPEPQELLDVYDLRKKALRTLAIRDIQRWVMVLQPGT